MIKFLFSRKPKAVPMAVRYTNAANAIQRVICNGTYEGAYMCTSLMIARDKGDITPEQARHAIDYIQSVVGDQVMIRHQMAMRPRDLYLREVQQDSMHAAQSWELYNKGAGDYPELSERDESALFVRRIELSNVYWGMIHDLRTRVANIHANACK